MSFSSINKTTRTDSDSLGHTPTKKRCPSQSTPTPTDSYRESESLSLSSLKSESVDQANRIKNLSESIGCSVMTFRIRQLV